MRPHECALRRPSLSTPGTKASMASQPARSTAAANGESAPEDAAPIGPPSGLSAIPTQHIAEQNLRQMLKSINYDEAREDNYRLKGVHLIDNVRESLQL